MKTLKILMFGWEFPPLNSGGLGVACEGLVRALSKEDVELTFVLPDKAPELLIENVTFCCGNNSGNLKIRRIKSSLLPYDNQNSYRNRNSSGSLYEAVRNYAKQAKNIARKEDFDIIHAHDWLSFGAGIEAKKISKKPLIVHVHATEYDRNGGLGNPTIHRLEKKGLEQADQVITVSNFTKNKVAENYKIPKEKIEVVYNGVPQNTKKILPDLTALKKNGKKVVLFLGRITLQKGPDYFLEAARIVAKERPDTIFIMAGSGDMQNKMIEKSAQAGIAENIIFPGFVRGNDIQRLYEMADLYVMPSVSEPFGIVALEALSNKTPIIISKQSGVSEVISHALKVDFWDTQDIASKIIFALENKTLRDKLGKKGFLEAQKMTWKKAAKKCKSIYNKLLLSSRKKKK